MRRTGDIEGAGVDERIRSEVCLPAVASRVVCFPSRSVAQEAGEQDPITESGNRNVNNTQTWLLVPNSIIPATVTGERISVGLVALVGGNLIVVSKVLPARLKELKDELTVARLLRAADFACSGFGQTEEHESGVLLFAASPRCWGISSIKTKNNNK